MQRMHYHIAGQTDISDITAQSYSKIRICGWNEFIIIIIISISIIIITIQYVEY